MSESDTSIPPNVADLAKALMAVRQHIKSGSGLYRSLNSWFGAKVPHAIPMVRDPWDRRKCIPEAAAEFVEAVDTANRMLNAIPVSALEPLSKFSDGVRWDVRTRRTLREIQYQMSFLRSFSRDPQLLLLGLRSMGKEGFMEMKSNLKKYQGELAERIFDLSCLPDALSGQTKPISGQQRAHQEPAANPNGDTQSDSDSIECKRTGSFWRNSFSGVDGGWASP